MARIAVALSLLVWLAVPARARLYDREVPRPEAGLETVFILFDADAAFDELDPVVLFGLSIGAHVFRDVRLGVTARFSLSDPEADHVEVLGDLTWAWVDEPRYYDPPAMRVGVSLEVGWHFTELHGSDFVVTSDGISVSLAGELGVVVFEDVALSLQLATLAAAQSNSVLDDWAPTLRLGLVISTLW